MIADADFEEVQRAIREVSASVIMPKFRSLAPDEIHEKHPGDLVTVADRKAEEELTARLLDIDPRSVVVGEEAVAADPAVLDCASAGGRVWLVDPIDGTGSFARGKPRFAVMIALLEDGQTVASWIWQPVPGRMFTARLGAGALLDGQPLPRSAGSPVGELTGDVRTVLFAPEMRDQLKARAAGNPLLRVDRGGACGYAYPELATGELGFAVFGRQYPWDHAAGALLIGEAGGAARDLDGAPYLPTETTWGLLSVSDATQWQALRDRLFSDRSAQ